MKLEEVPMPASRSTPYDPMASNPMAGNSVSDWNVEVTFPEDKMLFVAATALTMCMVLCSRARMRLYSGIGTARNQLTYKDQERRRERTVMQEALFYGFNLERPRSGGTHAAVESEQFCARTMFWGARYFSRNRARTPCSSAKAATLSIL